MNFQSRNKSILTGILMVVAALSILLAASFMMLKEQERVDRHMNTAVGYASSQVNEKLTYVKNSLDLMSSYFNGYYTKLDLFTEKSTREEMVNDLKKQMFYALRAEELCYTGYFRIAPELAQNGKEGFFIGYNAAGEIEEFEITDLSNYDPQDIEHVGWYSLPLNYGHAVWMEPYFNANKDVAMISYVVPLYVEEKFVGVIGMDIDVEDLTAFVHHLELDKGCDILLQDRGGNPLPGMAVKDDRTAYVEKSGTLLNEMSIIVYEQRRDAYVVRYHFGYYVVILFTILLMIYGISYLVIYQKRGDATSADRRVPLVPMILAGLAVLSAIGLVLFYRIATGSITFNQREDRLEAHNVYPHQITVVADDKCAPFSCFDEDGKPTGYDVAMIYELADRFKYNVELKLLPWNECLAEMRAGRADVILGLDVASDHGENFLMTEVTSTDTLQIYGKTPVVRITDVASKKVATVEDQNQVDAYGILLGADRYASYEEEFHALKIGKVDYVVARKAVADKLLEDEEYAAIQPVYNLMQCMSCYGVNPKNHTVHTLLNRAIEGVKKNGMDLTFREKYIVTKENKSFTERYGTFFYTAIAIIALLLVSSVLVFFVQRNNRRLRRLSEIDALTKINNRGGGEAKIRALIRQKIPGMFCLLDIDKFKSINDTYGHGVGDQVLIAMADCMKVAFRDRDIIMRLGGDEFAVYVPQVCDKETGTKVILRFFEEIHMLHIDDLEGHEVNVSLGATFYTGDSTDDFAAIYMRADKGTYISKKMIGNTYHFEVDE